MSIFAPVTAQCPQCGTEQTVDLVASVNADRRPDLRQQILDHTFQGCVCKSCGATFRLPPRFTYQHFKQHLWIVAHPRDDLDNWAELDALTAEIFTGNFGPSAPPMAQRIGGQISPRVVFGWPALREKLVAREAGLDDVELELLKMAVIRNVTDSPLADETELRLDRVEGDEFVLAWVEGMAEAPQTALRVPRAVYDEIVADTAGWAALRAEFAGHTFVDLNRLLRPEAPAAAA